MKYTKIKASCLTYILVAAITYGYAYNQEHNWRIKTYPERQAWCEVCAEISGITASMFWPIWWPFHISRRIWSNAFDLPPG